MAGIVASESASSDMRMMVVMNGTSMDHYIQMEMLNGDMSVGTFTYRYDGENSSRWTVSNQISTVTQRWPPKMKKCPSWSSPLLPRCMTTPAGRTVKVTAPWHCTSVR